MEQRGLRAHIKATGRSVQGQLLNRRQLLTIAIFAAAFSFVKTAVVVYLRAAVRAPRVQRNLNRPPEFLSGLRAGNIDFPVSSKPPRHRGLSRGGLREPRQNRTEDCQK